MWAVHPALCELHPGRYVGTLSLEGGSGAPSLSSSSTDTTSLWARPWPRGEKRELTRACGLRSGGRGGRGCGPRPRCPRGLPPGQLPPGLPGAATGARLPGILPPAPAAALSAPRGTCDLTGPGATPLRSPCPSARGGRSLFGFRAWPAGRAGRRPGTGVSPAGRAVCPRDQTLLASRPPAPRPAPVPPDAQAQHPVRRPWASLGGGLRAQCPHTALNRKCPNPDGAGAPAHPARWPGRG